MGLWWIESVFHSIFPRKISSPAKSEWNWSVHWPHRSHFPKWVCVFCWTRVSSTWNDKILCVYHENQRIISKHQHQVCLGLLSSWYKKEGQHSNKAFPFHKIFDIISGCVVFWLYLIIQIKTLRLRQDDVILQTMILIEFSWMKTYKFPL